MKKSKKKRILTLIACAAFVLSGAASFSLENASAANGQTTAAAAIVSATASNLNGMAEGEVFDYAAVVTRHTVAGTAVSPDFTESRFTKSASGALSIDGWEKPASLAGSAYGPYMSYKEPFNDSNGMVRMNWEENVSFKLTFKENALLRIEHEAIAGIVSSDNVIRLRIYLADGKGDVSLLSEKALYADGKTEREANYFGGEFNVSKGQSVYFEYGCLGAYEKNVKASKLGGGIFPTFIADPAAFSSEFTLDLAGMISSVYGAEGEKVDYNEDVSFEIMHGLLGAEEKFDKFAGSALQTQALNDGGQYASVYAGSQLVRTNGAKDKLIVKINAKKDIGITVQSAESANPANGTGVFQFMQKTEDDLANEYYAELKSVSVSSAAAAKNVLGGTYSIPAGDTFYLFVNGGAFGTNIYLFPTFVIDSAAFNPENTYDFSAVIALTQYRNAAKAELTAEFAALDETAYEAEDFADLSALYNDYISKIESAETEEQVDFFVAEYGKETEKIFTAAEKSELRAKYVKQIEDCYSSLDLKEYGEEEKAELASIVAEGKEKIAAAKTENAMKIAVEYAVNEMNLVEKTGERGCNSQFGSLPFAGAAALLGAACLFLRRRKDDAAKG